MDDYYDTLKRECVPIGHTVNPNIAMVTGFSVPRATRRRRAAAALDGFRFFGYALGHHYVFGSHKPGRTDIWKSFESGRDAMPDMGRTRDRHAGRSCASTCVQFEDAGVDQVIFIQQGGRNRHEHICESLELFAARVMPEFHAREDARAKRKAEELAPYLEQALARKARLSPLPDGEIPSFQAYGRTITEVPKP